MSETTTALVKRNPIDSMVAVKEAGEFIAKSGMFGADTIEKGQVIAMVCCQENLSLMEFLETYHIVLGRPAMRADAMLAKFIQAGGEYKPLIRTPDEARVLGKFKGNEMEFGLTFEGAKLEPFVWDKSGKNLKDNWATPYKRTQMLWARVVSEMVRTLCPLANKGSYTPEEVQDFEELQERPEPKRLDKLEVKERTRKTEKPLEKVVEKLEPEKAEPIPAAVEAVLVEAEVVHQPVAEDTKANDIKDLKDEKDTTQPMDYSVVPAGKIAGQRWDSLSADVLKYLLDRADMKVAGERPLPFSEGHIAELRKVCKTKGVN